MLKSHFYLNKFINNWAASKAAAFFVALAKGIGKKIFSKASGIPKFHNRFLIRVFGWEFQAQLEANIMLIGIISCWRV